MREGGREEAGGGDVVNVIRAAAAAAGKIAAFRAGTRSARFGDPTQLLSLCFLNSGQKKNASKCIVFFCLFFLSAAHVY